MENITLGQLQTTIIFLATFLTFELKIGKKILDKSLEPFNKRIDEMDKLRVEQHKETKEEIKKLKEELDKNSLNTMKNTICNENIPLSERIDVFKEYVDKGGNGAVKIYGHQLEERYEKELKEGGKHNETTR